MSSGNFIGKKNKNTEVELVLKYSVLVNVAYLMMTGANKRNYWFTVCFSRNLVLHSIPHCSENGSEFIL